MGYRAVGLMQCAVKRYCCLRPWGMWKPKTTFNRRSARRNAGRAGCAGLPGAKAGMMTFFGYCAVESTLGLWGATYISQVRGVSEATAASFGAMFYIGITVGRAASGFMAMKAPAQADGAEWGRRCWHWAALMMIPAGSTLSGIGLVVCGLGCAPIYPEHHTEIRRSTTARKLAGGHWRTDGVCVCGFDLPAVHFRRDGRGGRI